MKQSQQKYVEKILLNYGRISRNHCLQERITRLGAIVNILNNQGWTIVGQYEKTKLGKDYIYTAEKVPYLVQEYTIAGTDNKIKKYVKEKLF